MHEPPMGEYTFFNLIYLILINDDRFKNTYNIFHACLKKLQQVSVGEKQQLDMITDVDLGTVFNIIGISIIKTAPKQSFLRLDDIDM